MPLWNDYMQTDQTPARARAALNEHRKEIIDGRDLLSLCERDLMKPLDDKARALVMGSAKRVSVVTAVSPRAPCGCGIRSR